MPERFKAISSPMFDMVVATTVALARVPRACISRAASNNTASPLTQRPSASQNKARSASPSKVTPRSKFSPLRSTSAFATLAACSAPQPSLMFLPVGEACRMVTGTPSLRNSSGASAAAAPLAQSARTLSLLKSAKHPQLANRCSHDAKTPRPADSAQGRAPQRLRALVLNQREDLFLNFQFTRIGNL